MIGDERESGAMLLRPRPVAAEEPVDLPEVALADPGVARELRLRDRRVPRRCEGREDVADRVGALEIDEGEVRRPVAGLVERRARELVVDARFDHDPAQRRDRVVVGALGAGMGRESDAVRSGR